MFKRDKKKTSKTKAVDLDINQAMAIKDRLAKISEGDTIGKEDEKIFHMAAQLVDTLITIYGMWNNSKKKVNKLLRMIFGNSSEKTKDLGPKSSPSDNTNGPDSCIGNNNSDEHNHNQEEDKQEEDSSNNSNLSDGDAKNKKDKEENPRKGGGGKNSAEDYDGAIEVTCSLHDHLAPGSVCPACGTNKLYEIDPKKVIRLVGNAPIFAYKFVLQQVRCVCGVMFTADVGDEHRDIYNADKYGPSALAAMIIYKYLMGVSFGNLSSIQNMKGVPLPASTQANKIRTESLPVMRALFEVLKKLATNAHVLGFDDTVIKTLEKRETKDGKNKTHRGHGTAVIANNFDYDENTIVLFDFNPSKHAGDVVCDLLLGRTRESLPLLVADGLNSYDECKKQGVDVSCNVHARRKVVEEDPKKETYVGEAVIDCYYQIYKNEGHCKANNLSKVDRMEYHKEHSTAYFEKIEAIFNIITGVKDTVEIRQKYLIPDCVVEDEPNGDLRSIANYFLTRYKSLTRVINTPGAPLDTNYVERAIKLIIRLRKNSLFFNNISSASYSGEILSLLETAVANDVNVFEYIDYILTHKNDVLKRPSYYLPWLYRKEKKDKEAYWKGIEELKKSPSNFFEPQSDESYHSSA